MLAYTRHVCGFFPYILGLIHLAPMLFRFRIGTLDRTEAKESWLTYFLGGKSITELEKKAHSFTESILPNMVKKSAMDRLKWHQKEGHLCILVTASLEFWTHAWASKHNLILLATKGMVENQQFTGKLNGPNCWGIEKKKRVESHVDLSSIQTIYAYGDSAGDREILSWADYGAFRFFQ